MKHNETVLSPMKIIRLSGFVLLSVLITTSVAIAQQQWNPGFAIGTASGKYTVAYNRSPGQLVEIHPAAIPNTGLSYQWYSSPYPNMASFNPVTSGGGSASYTIPSLTQTTYYYLKTASATLGSANSNIIKIRVVPSDWEDINYLREYDVHTTQSSTSAHDIDQLPIGKKMETTTYLDGLGRPLQKNSKGTATPASGSSWGDMVQFYQYDTYGRQPKHYLPYTTTTTPGKYKSAPLTEQPQYYTSLYDETAAYSNSTYDNSPLNRVINVKAPGTSWAAAAGNSAAYDINSIADSVQIFSMDYVEGDAPVHVGPYPANTLYKLTTTDENGKKVVTYSDMSGRLILKKIQLSNTPSTGHAGWICVYSIYDDFGLLRYRLQPEAVSYLDTHSWSFAGTTGTQILNEQCFQYDYDAKGRVTWKKSPGQQPQQIIYDSRDRVVFTQDGNQAALTTPQWTATLYDDLDRPTITALYNTTETPAQLQADVEGAVNNSTITVTSAGSPVNDLVVDQRDPTITTYKARNSITFASDAGGGFSSVPGDNFVAEIDPDAVTPTTPATVTVFNNPIPAAKLNDPAVSTVLKYLFYDDYSYIGAKAFAGGFENNVAYSNSDPDVVPVAASKRTTGFLTGSMVRVLGTNTFLTTTRHYDEKGQLIQTLNDNIKSGTDVTTLQYHFDGRLLSADTKHSTAHTGYSNFHVLTKYLFDKIGRVSSIQKQLGPNPLKTIASYDYDDMGRLKTRHLDPDYPSTTGTEGLESLNYTYNIHNQITGINKDYALKTPGEYNNWNHYFGMYLGYDNRNGKFNAARLDGHVTGQMWNTQGDDAQRKYDYTYDNPGRISAANFTQYDGSVWNTGDGVNFTVNNVAYDLNGNLSHMNQYGLKVNTSSAIDNLSYTYQSYSNKLSKITDAANDANSTLGDFHYSSKGSTDYTYDYNGNLKSDANKKISSITYNYIDLPGRVHVTDKGNIKFLYDADGNKLQKIVIDSTVNPVKTTTTSYIDGFVYKEDTLQFIQMEEGRIRPIIKTGQPDTYTYDYFIRDYLGNVRTVITEQTGDATYASTMEPQNATVEDQLFTNVSSTTVNKPTGFDGNTNNKQVSQLDGSQGDNSLPRTGPAIVLKVMAGDTVTIGTYAWYQGAIQPPPSNATNLLDDLLNALTGGVISNSHGQFSSTDNNPTTILSGDLNQFFTDKEDDQYTTTKPKAFLNWAAFDNQLKMVSANSGVVQVPQITAGEQAQPLIAPEQVIQKNGYLYIYVSNESAQKVFFDNLVIHHKRGHLLEEEQYYPFGLTMAGISTVAPLRPENNYKYNGKELNHHEFSDLSGINWYDYGFRNYDPQIGRFMEQDPLTDASAPVSPYQYAYNDPVANTDMDGLAPTNLLCPATSGLAVFLDNAIAAISHVATAASPAEKVIIHSAHALQLAGVLHNFSLTNKMINNGFTAKGVGMEDEGAGQGDGNYDPPSWLKELFDFFGVFTNTADPKERAEFARRDKAIGAVGDQLEVARRRLDKYSIWIPVVGGLVKTSEGMVEDKPLTSIGGMASIGIDIFGGEILRGLGNATKTGGELLLKSGVGNLTQKGLEHIIVRHWFTSEAKGVGKFLEGTTARELKEMINTATTNGIFRPNTMGRAGTIVEYNFGRVIGTTSGKIPASNLRVVIGTNGNVITAFPF